MNTYQSLFKGQQERHGWSSGRFSMRVSDAENLLCWSEINRSSCFNSGFSSLPLGMRLTLAEGVV